MTEVTEGTREETSLDDNGPSSGVFASVDQLRLAWSYWAAERPKAGVHIVHGLSEHRGRYAALASALVSRGYSVFAFDQRGHGESGGRRGDAPAFESLVDDVQRSMAVHRRLLPRSAPIVLLGHSMGGLVTLRYLQKGEAGIRGAVLSAPWLKTVLEVPQWKYMLGNILRKVAPGFPIQQRPNGALLTRDPELAEAYERDPLVHRQITPRLYFEVRETQERILSGPTPRRTPLLFLVPLDDEVTDPDTTLVYAGRIEGPATTVETLPDFRHEPFNEIDRERVFRILVDWLDTLI